MADGYKLELTRVLAVPPSDVFDAWTNPDKLRRWWGPEGMSAAYVELDPRPGGAWRTCMKSDADGSEHWCQGVYREVVPPERLVFTWAWETDGEPGDQTLVTIEFRDLGGKTEMRFRHEGFETEQARDDHNAGWTSSFVCLERASAGNKGETS
jgi:uncharacterized protein YndB with AHSA1/START domain